MGNIVIEADGIAPVARFIASPNCDARPQENDISLVVIHNISLPPGQYDGDGVIALFTNHLDAQAQLYYAEIQHLKVSAHPPRRQPEPVRAVMAALLARRCFHLARPRTLQ